MTLFSGARNDRRTRSRDFPLHWQGPSPPISSQADAEPHWRPNLRSAQCLFEILQPLDGYMLHISRTTITRGHEEKRKVSCADGHGRQRDNVSEDGHPPPGSHVEITLPGSIYAAQYELSTHTRLRVSLAAIPCIDHTTNRGECPRRSVPGPVRGGAERMAYSRSNQEGISRIVTKSCSQARR